MALMAEEEEDDTDFEETPLFVKSMQSYPTFLEEIRFVPAMSMQTKFSYSKTIANGHALESDELSRLSTKPVFQ